MVFGKCCSGVLSGWNASGMKVWKPCGFVLQGAQLQQMIDAVFVVLDVAVEHGGVRLQADLVGSARGLQPLVAVNLVIADDVAHAVGENLRAAARQRVHAGALSASPASPRS